MNIRTHQDGTLLNGADLLANVANRYSGLSDMQKSILAETLGGVFQVNMVKSLVKAMK